MKSVIKNLTKKIAINLMLLSTTSIFSQNGSVDNSFGNSGVAFKNVGQLGDSQGVKIALQNDGKIVQAGSSFNGTKFEFVVLRFNSNGTIDNSFGNNGQVNYSFTNFDNNALDVAIQSDGKIIVAGNIKVDANDFDFAVLRLNSNGSLDTSFGVNGKIQNDFIGFNVPDSAQKIAIQNDGKIIVAGLSYTIDDSFDFAIARYNTNGDLDTSFGTNGKKLIGFNATIDDDIANDMVLQNDGKILVVGQTSNGNNLNYALARLNTNGSLDTSFDGDGKLTYQFNTNDNIANAIAIQNNGKIIITGEIDTDDNASIIKTDFATLRFNADGSLDTSFGQNGKLITDFGSNDDSPRAIQIQNDGKILIAGTSNKNYAMARYNIDGSPDNANFGSSNDGKVVLTTPDNDVCTAMKLQPDGKILLSGITSNGFTNLLFVVIRFNNQILSIFNQNLDNPFETYPNPTKSVINISNPLNYSVEKIEIVDISGKTVFENNQNNNQVNVENLQNGIYFLKIQTSEKVFQSKFVKE